MGVLERHGEMFRLQREWAAVASWWAGAGHVSELGCTLMCLEAGEDRSPKGEPRVAWHQCKSPGGTQISKQNHIRVL